MRPPRTLPWISAGATLGIVLGLALWVGHPSNLDAAGVGTSAEDSDKDGLTNVQEQVLGTSTHDDDSDGDGFGDLEELARGSDPRLPTSCPGTGAVSVGMFARSEEGVVTVASAVYVGTGPFSAADYQFGVVVDGKQINIPTNAYLKATRVELFLTEGNGRVALLETRFPERIVRNLGSVSPFATVDDPAAGLQVATANLVVVGGVVMNVQSSSPPSGGSGLIYQPLVPPDQSPPNTTTKGQVCFQQTRVVGSNGSSLVQEVESAGCEPLSGFCSSSDCSGSVGSTVQIADPAALLGG